MITKLKPIASSRMFMGIELCPTSFNINWDHKMNCPVTVSAERFDADHRPSKWVVRKADMIMDKNGTFYFQHLIYASKGPGDNVYTKAGEANFFFETIEDAVKAWETTYEGICESQAIDTLNKNSK